MMSPKEQFQLNKDEAGKFGEMIDSPLFRKAVVYAKAQFVSGSPNSEWIVGMNGFLSVLTTLHEEEKQTKLPVRELKSLQITSLKPKQS